MINAMVFDLDGTLVQTERLKAQSYAQAAVELCPRSVTDDEVISAYKDVVGRSREEVATALMQRFDLAPAARQRMDAYGVDRPWQAFVQVRLDYYEDMVHDPDVIRAHCWPHTMDLLNRARTNRCAVALATTSRRDQAHRVLGALDLTDTFDFTATADDVTRTKPHPEIYRLTAVNLGVHPERTLAIEDSPSGVDAACTAGLHCIAMTTDFTRDALRAADVLDARWIVDDPDALPNAVQTLIDEQAEA